MLVVVLKVVLTWMFSHSVLSKSSTGSFHSLKVFWSMNLASKTIFWFLTVRIHSVSSYKERCKLWTSPFFNFFLFFYDFCSLVFKFFTVIIL